MAELHEKMYEYKVVETLPTHDRLARDFIYFERFMRYNASTYEASAELPEAILDELDVLSAGDGAGVDVDGTHMLFSCVPQDVLQNSCLVQGHTEEVKQVHVWTKSSTKFFLEAYLVRAEKFRDPKIKKKILWTEIVAEMEGVGFVGVTEDAVDRKMQNLRKTYRGIKDNNRKSSTGRGTISWEYFEIFEEIFARDSTINFGATISSFKPVQVPPLTVPVPYPSPAASSSSLLTTPSAPASPTSPSSFFSESQTFPFVSDENSLHSPNADRRKEKNKNSRECYNLRKNWSKLKRNESTVSEL